MGTIRSAPGNILVFTNMKLEVLCLRQLYNRCNCTPDEDNKKCPEYRPVTIRYFKAEKELIEKYIKSVTLSIL